MKKTKFILVQVIFFLGIFLYPNILFAVQDTTLTDEYQQVAEELKKLQLIWSSSPQSSSITVFPGDVIEFTISAVQKTTQSQEGVIIKCDNCGEHATISSSENGNIKIKFDTSKFNINGDDIQYTFSATINGDVGANPYKYLIHSKLVACENYTLPTECESAETKNQCVWNKKTLCLSVFEKSCDYAFSEDVCKKLKYCDWEKQNNRCITKQESGVNNYILDNYGVPTGYSKEEGGSGILPPCAFTGNCRDINQLLDLVIRIVEYLFGFIAGLAFVFFVYGGFTMMLSFGNAEKVKKGQQVLVAAVIGLVIVFSAYMLIGFLLNTLGVQSGFRVL